MSYAYRWQANEWPNIGELLLYEHIHQAGPETAMCPKF